MEYYDYKVDFRPDAAEFDYREYPIRQAVIKPLIREIYKTILEDENYIEYQRKHFGEESINAYYDQASETEKDGHSSEEEL